MSISVSKSMLRNFQSTPSHVLLFLLWLIGVVGGIGSLLSSLNGLADVGGSSSFAFILILIWTLAQKKPYSTDLPDVDLFLTPHIGFGTATLALVASIRNC